MTWNPHLRVEMWAPGGALYIGFNFEDHRVRSVYRAKNSLKVFWLGFLAFSVFFSITAWVGISAGTNIWIDVAVGILLVCVGAFGAAQTFIICVVLTEESIRCGSVFRRQSMRLDQIRYRLEYEEYQESPEGNIHVHYLELVPYDGDSPSLKISKDDFDFDHAFWDWVFRIPDLSQPRSGLR